MGGIKDGAKYPNHSTEIRTPNLKNQTSKGACQDDRLKVGGFGEEPGDPGNGNLTLVLGLVLEHCVSKTQLRKPLPITEL